MIVNNFNNPTLGIITETVEVKERLSGIDIVKFFTTSYTVIGFNYIMKNNQFFFDVDNKILNNEIVIKDTSLSVGDKLIVNYNY